MNWTLHLTNWKNENPEKKHLSVSSINQKCKPSYIHVITANTSKIKKHKRHFFKNVENTAEHEESFCNSWSLKLVQYSVKRISAEICGEFYILHVANSHRRPPETVASRRVGSAVWIGFSTTQDCRRRKIWSLNILRLFERRTGLAARQHDENPSYSTGWPQNIV